MQILKTKPSATHRSKTVGVSSLDKYMNDTAFVKQVLTHYKKYGRHDLPWRKNPSAYRVLVSELMLQQTQVSRVIPKFRLWMKQYPTLSALRGASLRDVLLLWEGLGYQRRAKALHEIAKEMLSVPRTFELLNELPGVGPYTAAAIVSFAYDEFEHPLLETNIRTALIEYFYKHKNAISDELLYKKLRVLEKEKAVQNVGARVWYSALMDYGAHLKAQNISHNAKTKNYKTQSEYKGSLRELRAKILFAITHKETLPVDERREGVVSALIKEKFIVKKGKGYAVS